MSHQSLTQPNKNHKPTRREVLKGLATIPLIAAPLLALPALTESALDYDMPPPNVVLYTDGFGPAERAAAIRRWYWRFDVLIQLGEKMQVFLEEAHVLPPDQVDGMRMLTLEWEVLDKLHALTCQMETVEFDDDYKLITGWRSYLWCLKHDIQTGKGLEPDRIQLEIDAIREDDPAAADELQALLDARYRGVK